MEETLWRKWYPRLAAYIRCSFPSLGEEAEDVVQDCFLRLMQVRLRDDPAPLFYRTTRNLCIDRLRKKKPLPLAEEAISIPDERSGTAEERMIAEETRSDVDRAMQSLTAADRELCFLRFYEDMKVREIAAMLGKPEGTVKFGLYRAREALRIALEGSHG